MFIANLPEKASAVTKTRLQPQANRAVPACYPPAPRQPDRNPKNRPKVRNIVSNTRSHLSWEVAQYAIQQLSTCPDKLPTLGHAAKKKQLGRARLEAVSAFRTSVGSRRFGETLRKGTSVHDTGPAICRLHANCKTVAANPPFLHSPDPDGSLRANNVS